MELFSSLGFSWDRTQVPVEVPVHWIERATFHVHRMLAEFTWEASMLEGHPLTFPEVKTLLDGVTVGGRKISDQDQVLNLAKSSKQLLALVRANEFVLNKETFTLLHSSFAMDEALEWGCFRGEVKEVNSTPNVGLGSHGSYTPLPTVAGAPELNRVFEKAIEAIELELSSSFEKALIFFLFGALQQFFFDGNKRTSRFMMNGLLMSSGIDAISIPVFKAAEFNAKMVDFYLNKKGTEMMAFLLDCHPDAKTIREMN
jgi:Fic family protein